MVGKVARGGFFAFSYTAGLKQSPKDFPDAEELQSSKSRKRLVLTGASRFNTKPKVGLSFLEENELIYSDLSEGLTRPQSLAKFLKGCTRLDKRLLGDFISRSENIDVLKAFMTLFDFKGVSAEEGSRYWVIAESVHTETHTRSYERASRDFPIAG